MNEAIKTPRIGKRLCCALYPFLNPHWYLEKNLFMCMNIYLDKIFSSILKIIGRMLTDR